MMRKQRTICARTKVVRNFEHSAKTDCTTMVSDGGANKQKQSRQANLTMVRLLEPPPAPVHDHPNEMNGLALSNLPSQVHAHGEVAVTSVLVKAVGPQAQRHQAHVGVVHSLEFDAGIGAVEGRLIEEVFDGIEYLLQDNTLNQACFEHFE